MEIHWCLKNRKVFGNTQSGIPSGRIAVQQKAYSGRTFLIIRVIEYMEKSKSIEAIFLYLTEYQQYAILKNIHILDSVEGEE